MGNLLSAPVTEKETHGGSTSDGDPYAVSSMQGWRVHMEDAHITEHRIYASDPAGDTTNGSTNCNEIVLPGHSLFAVFDGHGGTFAAEYAGRNLCRVLSREPKFLAYAKFELERPQKESQLATAAERNNYTRSGLDLLESALCDAFVDLDREIACALRGNKVPDADWPYNHDSSQHSSPQSPPTNDGNEMDKDHAMEGVSDAGASAAPPDSALQLLEEEGDSGTTACVVMVTPGYVVCANAGDSRAVISRLGNKAVPLSFDHKPDDEEEERRIRAAGGYVAGGRVEGDLAVSRGLGDFRFKQMDVVMAASNASRTANETPPDPVPMDEPAATPGRPQSMGSPGDQKVSPVPDITVQSRNDQQDEFLIIACDGIWDVQTNYEAVQNIAELFKEGESNVGLICEEVCDQCLTMGSKDNMTTLIVKFRAQTVGEGGGVLARRQLREEAADEIGEDNPASPTVEA